MEFEDLIGRWSFNWGVMDVLIGGKSAIDLEELRFNDWEEATAFIRHYGYDPDNSRDARRIHAMIIESIDFIARYLIPEKWSQGLKPPEKLLVIDDVRDLLLISSRRSKENRWEQAWACGILRVMHTIAHMDSLSRFVDLDDAREQIMDRFRRHVFRNEKDELHFGVPGNSVPVDRVEWKHSKSRDSIILKLLHKKANVAETIYDLIGVRIVTEKLADVMMILKFLRDFHLITFTNCNPSRSRNNLIDVDNFKHNISTLTDLLVQKNLQGDEFLKMVHRVTLPLTKSSSSSNPHSSRSYRSVQLTCRHFIRFVNPFMKWRERLEQKLLSDNLDEKVQKRITDLLFLSKNPMYEWEGNHMMGFFPFELHVLDAESYDQNTLGDANHNLYKRSQLRAARRRVLAQVLSLKPPVK